tara:strand:+ start:210 stop:845 length:636 start_codon:yes stop_codon:yes gene_type:complete
MGWMKFNLVKIFPQPVLQTKLIIEPEWMKYINSIKYIRNVHNNGYVSTDFKILNTKKLKTLKSKINNVIKNYMEEHLKISNKLKITASWVMKHVKNDFAQTHFHHNSIISGVLYLQTKKGAGDLIFEREGTRHNFLSEMLAFDRIENTTLNAPQLSFNTETGILLVFPSNLSHYTLTMPFDNYERICLSFNTFISGSMGAETNRIELNEEK